MGKAIAAFICFFIVCLDIVAGILGLQAEVAQNKVRHQKVWIFDCREPSREAYRLGLAAALILALAHVIGVLLGGCVCICSKAELDRSSAYKKLAAACSILSWILLALGFSTLMIGAMSNLKSRASCGLSHHKFLSVGEISCFIHGLVSVSYYVAFNAAYEKSQSLPQ